MAEKAGNQKNRIEVTTPGCRERFETWIRDRGGVAVWHSINLSNPNAGKMFTPAQKKAEDGGGAYPKPHWGYELQVVTNDISLFRFCTKNEEVKRLHVAVRMGSQGLSLKLTDGSSRRLRAAMNKVEEFFDGRPPCYHFEEDFGMRDAVITVPVFEDDEPGWFEQRKEQFKKRFSKKKGGKKK